MDCSRAKLQSAEVPFIGGFGMSRPQMITGNQAIPRSHNYIEDKISRSNVTELLSAGINMLIVQCEERKKFTTKEMKSTKVLTLGANKCWPRCVTCRH